MRQPDGWASGWHRGIEIQRDASTHGRVDGCLSVCVCVLRVEQRYWGLCRVSVTEGPSRGDDRGVCGDAEAQRGYVTCRKEVTEWCVGPQCPPNFPAPDLVTRLWKRSETDGRSFVAQALTRINLKVFQKEVLLPDRIPLFRRGARLKLARTVASTPPGPTRLRLSSHEAFRRSIQPFLRGWAEVGGHLARSTPASAKQVIAPPLCP